MGDCLHCGSPLTPVLLIDTLELNLKRGGPSVEAAIEYLTIHLRRASEMGLKAMILIHGYGSSGEGGRIKWAVHHALENNHYSDRVVEYYFGENVPYGSDSYHALMRKRPNLKNHLKLFKVGNPGITVLLLA